MLKLRSKVTFSLNAVLTSQAKLATLDAAIFRSRYYLSGSLLNHSSSMPISRGFGQKLAHARKVVDSLGSDHQDKARFVKIIEEKSDTVQELMSRASTLGMKADGIRGARFSIQSMKKFAEIEKKLQLFGITVSSPTSNPNREAEKHALYGKALSLENLLPRIMAKPTPGVLVPEDAELEGGPPTEAEVDEMEWRIATAAFGQNFGKLKKAFQTLEGDLKSAQEDPFKDIDQNDRVLEVKLGRAISDILATLSDLKVALKQTHNVYKRHRGDTARFTTEVAAIRKLAAGYRASVRDAVKQIQAAKKARLSELASDDTVTETDITELEVNVDALIDRLRTQDRAILIFIDRL